MASAETVSFYRDLPILDSFVQASVPSSYHPIPYDWLVAVTDIENSTDAIRQDKYKLVNILGASPIVGILNITDPGDIPFIFNGDGCAFCLPPSLLGEAQRVLSVCRKIGQEQYELNLRAAIFPIDHIRDQGYDVKVARYQVSDAYNQAIFTGGGLTFAEKELKRGTRENFHIAFESAGDASEVDFSGLECRWQEVSQKEKKVITLLVRSAAGAENSESVYRNILQELNNTFGLDGISSPVAASELKMSMSMGSLSGEIKLRTFGQSRFRRFLYFLKIEIQIILGKLFMGTGYRSSATDWSRYKTDLMLNTDNRKFDDMLRVVISGTEEQFHAMKQYLDRLYEEGRLVYGTHMAESAIITCMVFQYHRNHIHFVDGSDGGYVKAFRDLENRL